MRMAVDDAADLSRRVLAAMDFDADEQGIVTDRLIDATLRGEPSSLVSLFLPAKRLGTARPSFPLRLRTRRRCRCR